MQRVTQLKDFTKSNNNSALRFKGSNGNFDSRLKSGSRFEEHIVNYSKEELSLVLHPCGLAQKSPEAKQILTQPKGPAAEHMRYEHDFFAYIQPIQDIKDIEYSDAKEIKE